MENQITFVNGMIAKRQDNAPDFVLCNLSLKVEDLIQFMQQYQNNGWVNIDIKRSKQGKIFAALNTWRPDGNRNQQPPQNQQNVGYVQPQQAYQKQPQQPQQAYQQPKNFGQVNQVGDEDIPF